MKRALFIIGSVWFLLASGLAAQAQVSAELQAFQKASGDHSILYRGKQATRYNFPFNGNPYWEHAAFGEGDLVCEGNFYHGLSLNIDAVKQQVLVAMVDSPNAIALTPSQASSFTIDGRRFIGMPPGGALPEGFYAILGDGPFQIYKHVQKSLYHSTESANGELIGYDDPDYRPDVTRFFYIRTVYYFRHADGSFSRFRGRRALLRKFPGRRREIRRAINERWPDLSVIDFDAYCEAVLELAAR